MIFRKSHHPFCTAVIAAAGSSQRMGSDKLQLQLLGKTVLQRTLEAVNRSPLVDEIVVATRQEALEDTAALCEVCGIKKPLRVVVGGSSRTASVLAAALQANPKTEFIAVQDGARPLVTQELIDRVIRLAWRTNAAAPAIPVTNTVKVADGQGRVLSTPERSTLFAVQTPQVFQADILRAALQSALDNGMTMTDDCAAVERIGKQVYLTDGERENLKLTTPMDVAVAEAILHARGEKT